MSESELIDGGCVVCGSHSILNRRICHMCEFYGWRLTDGGPVKYSTEELRRAERIRRALYE